MIESYSCSDIDIVSSHKECEHKEKFRCTTFMTVDELMEHIVKTRNTYPKKPTKNDER